jgi:hypothetical protein
MNGEMCLAEWLMLILSCLPVSFWQLYWSWTLQRFSHYFSFCETIWRRFLGCFVLSWLNSSREGKSMTIVAGDEETSCDSSGSICKSSDREQAAFHLLQEALELNKSATANAALSDQCESYMLNLMTDASQDMAGMLFLFCCLLHIFMCPSLCYIVFPLCCS